MANQDIRDYAKQKNVPLWKIATRLNVCEMTITRKLRVELSEKEKNEFIVLIDSISDVKTY